MTTVVLDDEVDGIGDKESPEAFKTHPIIASRRKDS